MRASEPAIYSYVVLVILTCHTSYSSNLPVSSSYDDEDGELPTSYSSMSYSYGGDYEQIIGEGENAGTKEIFTSLNRLKELYNTKSTRRASFENLDLNHDGFLTKLEYRTMNGEVDLDMVDIIFHNFDENKDEQLSQGEFVDKGDFWDTTEDCQIFAINECDSSMAMVIEESDPSNDRDEMCNGIQTYVDCLFQEAAYCDLQDFLRAVNHWAETYKKTDLCPALKIKHTIPDIVGEPLDREKRSAINNDEVEERPELCASAELFSCTVDFNRNLKATADFCLTLDQYRHCITHAFKHCNDENLLILKESLKLLTREHRKFELCENT